MDWTLEDNMVDGLFFCATLEDNMVDGLFFCVLLRLLVQQERKRLIPVWRRLSRTQALLGRVTPGMGVCVGDVNAESCEVVCPLPHSIGDPPSAAHQCCCCQMNK